ncbi:uncharacterized protein ACJ7VT_020926 isoform 1-T1 [Polymixia lowei]
MTTGILVWEQLHTDTVYNSGQQLNIYNHLKMMRLLFLCLLLPAATASSSEETEGSTGEEFDDEDIVKPNRIVDVGSELPDTDPGSVDKTTGVENKSDQSIVIIITAVSLVALSVAVIVATVLVRRHINNREQGVYSVPAEQGQKA